jgi:hypothetical protein
LVSFYKESYTETKEVLRIETIRQLQKQTIAHPSNELIVDKSTLVNLYSQHLILLEKVSSRDLDILEFVHRVGMQLALRECSAIIKNLRAIGLVDDKNDLNTCLTNLITSLEASAATYDKEVGAC